MLTLINEELFNVEIQEGGIWNREDGIESYERAVIRTDCGAVAMRDGEDGEDAFEVAVNRVVTVHQRSTDPDARTRITSTIKEGDMFPRVSVRTSTNTKYPMDAYVIAIPYDGMMVPIDDNPNIDIWRFMIVKSSRRSIEYNGDQFKRCLYLVVSPKDCDIVSEDGFYPSSHDLVIKTVWSATPIHEQNTEDATWKVVEHRVRFGPEEWELVESVDEVPYDSVNPDDYRVKCLCNIVQPKLLKNNADQTRAGTCSFADAMKNAKKNERHRGGRPNVRRGKRRDN